MTGKTGVTPEQKPTGETPNDDAGETPTDEEQHDDLAGLRDALAKERTARRRFEAEAKKNATAAERLAEAENADKSEVQRATDKAAAAEARAKAAELRADRLEIAASKGIPPSLAGRLMGETREELEADADELLKVMKPGEGGDTADKGASPNGAGDSRARPKESLRSGAAPQAEPEENDPTKLAALIPRG
jgi:hypothetical protein